MPNTLTLKWGTIKAFHLETDEAKAAIRKWAAGVQKDPPEHKQALLEAIDLMDEIYLDQEGKKVSPDEAKEYLRTYGN